MLNFKFFCGPCRILIATTLLGLSHSTFAFYIPTGEGYRRPEPQVILPVVTRTPLLDWVKAPLGHLPPHTFTAGINGTTPVAVCQARHKQAVYPGQWTPHGCLITYSGQSALIKSFTLLTSQAKTLWKPPSALPSRSRTTLNHTFFGAVPKNSAINYQPALPVIGGMESINPDYPHPIYICRTFSGNKIRIGKVVAGRCNIAQNSKEASHEVFQVLFVAHPKF